MLYNIFMKFQEVIEKIMMDKNLSQKGLADALGVHQTTVGQWLCGKKKPSYDNILLIYEKFGIEPNALFDLK